MNPWAKFSLWFAGFLGCWAALGLLIAHSAELGASGSTLAAFGIGWLACRVYDRATKDAVICGELLLKFVKKRFPRKASTSSK